MKLFIFLLFIVSISCNRFNNTQKEPLAKVYSNYLYREDLAGLFPSGMSKADSAKIAKNYIDKWIRNQLFLRLAEMNLPAEEKNLDKQIADFRASLLIHKYQQYLLDQKLDSIINIKEIEDYYEAHSNNFILGKPAIRGIYIKVPIDTPGRNNLLSWFRSGNDLIQIENYSNQYAVSNIWFTESFIYLDNLLLTLPPGSYSANVNFANTDHITASDPEYYYFIGIQEYKPPRSQMPFSLASQKIKNIILNKRKIQFLNDLEKNVLNEGLSKNAFQYY